MRLSLLVKFLAVVVAVTAAEALYAANPADFTVQAATGTNVFKLSDAKGKFVALHFLLKTECPFCLRHTRDYVRKSAGDTNVVHVFLKPDTDAEINQWATKIGKDAPDVVIYRDPDATLAKAFKIQDGYRFHGQTVHYPALVLLDQKGNELFRYVGANNTDRLSYEKFQEKLKAAAAGKKP